jgi:phosphohistidine phosphatase
MKQLTIIRHAKAERPEEYPLDFDRPLTKRGHKEAKAVGKQLLLLEPAVDWLLSSPAVRARQTTEELINVCQYPITTQWQQEIYEASVDQLLGLLRNVPQEMTHVALVGHNPGLTELVSILCTGEAARLNLHLPTAGLAHLELEIFWWNQLRWGCGRLLQLI